MRKKLLALLLAAALALSLLAGCGGGESVASALLKLLDGRYPNISIEIDPELEADLRQAIRKAEAENAGDDAAVIRAALEKLVGSTVTFRKLGEGQQGDTTFDLVFYSGSDPGKAAQAAYSQWNIVFDNVPDDGKYGTGLAMVETENGIWMLVKATVEKAGTVDKPEPEPVTLKSLTVTGPSKTEYIKGQTFDSAGMTVTAHYSDGSFKPIAAGEYTIVIDDKEVSSSYQFDQVGSHTLKVKYNEMVSTNSVSIWVADENGYHEESGNYVVTGSNGLQKLYDDLKVTGDSFASAKITLNSPVTLDNAWPENITFTGELNGNGNTITMEDVRAQGLFKKIDTSGKVLNVDIEVSGTITAGSIAAGAIADENYGSISNCTVTIQDSGSITATVNAPTAYAYAGGIVGYNESSGSISNCTVTVNGFITATTTTSSYATISNARAGGIAGCNDGIIENCDVTIRGSITADASSTSTDLSMITEANAGGIAGLNGGTIESSCSVELNGGSIQATATGGGYALAYAGGIVGIKNGGTVSCGPATGADGSPVFAKAEYSNSQYTATISAGDGDPTAEVKSAQAGTLCGWDSSNNGKPTPQSIPAP